MRQHDGKRISTNVAIRAPSVLFGRNVLGWPHRVRNGRKEEMIESYGVIGWIVIGLLAGGIAKLLMPGRDPGGCIITILLGIAGALLAGFLGKAIGWYGPGEAAGFLAAIVGAFLILLIYRLVLRR
jgi:uncharacterized membrane protein YeaQ/YmgE (transglycosylase-associated protein family)